jgi:hypothetical protein
MKFENVHLYKRELDGDPARFWGSAGTDGASMKGEVPIERARRP